MEQEKPKTLKFFGGRDEEENKRALALVEQLPRRIEIVAESLLIENIVNLPYIIDYDGQRASAWGGGIDHFVERALKREACDHSQWSFETHGPFCECSEYMGRG